MGIAFAAEQGTLTRPPAMSSSATARTIASWPTSLPPSSRRGGHGSGSRRATSAPAWIIPSSCRWRSRAASPSSCWSPTWPTSRLMSAPRPRWRSAPTSRSSRSGTRHPAGGGPRPVPQDPPLDRRLRQAAKSGNLDRLALELQTLSVPPAVAAAAEAPAQPSRLRRHRRRRPRSPCPWPPPRRCRRRRSSRPMPRKRRNGAPRSGPRPTII